MLPEETEDHAHRLGNRSSALAVDISTLYGGQLDGDLGKPWNQKQGLSCVILKNTKVRNNDFGDENLGRTVVFQMHQQDPKSCYTC